VTPITPFEQWVFGLVVCVSLIEIASATSKIARYLKWFVDYKRDQKRALEREP
jgi:hypothetical protein